MTVAEIVREYLEKNDFDGLVEEDAECGCDLDDLAPCGEMRATCEAGHKTDCDPETCLADGDCAYHICAPVEGEVIYEDPFK